MAAKVADLIEDLETGDRSMEHLNKPAEPEVSMAELARRVMEGFGNIGAGLGQGLAGSGIGMGGLAQGMAQQQNAFNQLANQQMQNAQMFGSSNMLVGYASDSSGPKGFLGGI